MKWRLFAPEADKKHTYVADKTRTKQSMFLSFLQDPMHTTAKFISIQKQSKRKSRREKKETKKQEARTRARSTEKEQ